MTADVPERPGPKFRMDLPCAYTDLPLHIYLRLYNTRILLSGAHEARGWVMLIKAV